jgi:hypothetical protein
VATKQSKVDASRPQTSHKFNKKAADWNSLSLKKTNNSMTIKICSDFVITYRSSAQDHLVDQSFENVGGFFEVQNDDESTISGNSWSDDDESTIFSLDSLGSEELDDSWHDIDFPVSTSMPRSRRPTHQRMEELRQQGVETSMQRLSQMRERGGRSNAQTPRRPKRSEEHQEDPSQDDDSLRLTLRRLPGTTRTPRRHIISVNEDGRQQEQDDGLVNGLSEATYILSLNDSTPGKT